MIYSFTATLLLFALQLKILTSAFTPITGITTRHGHQLQSSMTNEVQTDEALDLILSVAVEASKKAGEIILGNAGGAEVAELKANSRDLLTLIDPLCEKVSMCVFVVGGLHCD